MKFLKIASVLFVAVFWMSQSSAATSTAYPASPIKIVVGYAPGGVADIASRLIAQALSESFGTSVVVDNKPGASGTIAAGQVARSRADGHTLLVSDSLILMPRLFSKLPFDPENDLVPVGLIAIGPSVLVASPSVSAKNIRELITLAKSKPGTLKYGSAGVGSMGHLMMGLFNSEAGLEMLHIPYKGSTPALNALMAGEVDLLFTSLAGVLPQIQAGRIKAYGLGLPAPSPALPGVVPIDQAGVPGYNAASWQGLYAPAGTPPEVLNTLSKVFTNAMSSPALRSRFEEAGLEPVGNSTLEFEAFIEKETPKWQRAIEESGVEPN